VKRIMNLILGAPIELRLVDDVDLVLLLLLEVRGGAPVAAVLLAIGRRP